MPTSQYFCRILFLDADQPLSGLKMNYTDTQYTDKKQFTMGSGSEADIQVLGPEVDAVHLGVRVEGNKLFIKNFSQGEIQLSSFRVPHDKVEPYTPGEAIRIAGFNRVIFVELFRKFVDPISESEAIIREAWDQAKEAEEAVEDHKQALGLLTKKASELKAAAETEANSIVSGALKKAKEIAETAHKEKEKLVKETLQEREATAQRDQKELERKMQELHIAAEENAAKLLEQGRQKNKELKQEAEQEIEKLHSSAQSQSDLIIEAAKMKASDLTEESRVQIETLTERKAEIVREIAQIHKQRATAVDDLATIKTELGGFEEIKRQLQQEYDLEKERLRLANSSLQDQVVAKESEMRAMQAKVEDFTVHFNQMTAQLAESKENARKELEMCQTEATEARQAKARLETESEKISLAIKDLTEKMNQLEIEQTAVTVRIDQLKTIEDHDRNKMRETLKAEYEERKEFEVRWHAQQRLAEQETAEKERLVREKLEKDQLPQQAAKIVEKILPLLNLEITAQLGSDRATKFIPQIEKLIGPIVERSVVEEYEFRRDHWTEIKPANMDRIIKDYKKSSRKQYSIMAVSILLFLMAIFITWSKATGLQVAYLTLTPSSESAASTPSQQQRLPSSQEPLDPNSHGSK